MTDNKDKIVRNLEDADCDSEIIQKFFEMKKSGAKSELLKLLETHRKNLLAVMHKKNKQIDCLDYLIFNIQQEMLNK